MATFSAYPALQVRAPDIPGAIQRGREDVQTNWLRQTKIQSGIAEQGRLSQLRAIMPGVGAEAGLGPNAQQALALDPSMLGKLLKIPKGERDQAKETTKVLSNFGMAILNASGIQRPPLDAQMRQAAAEYGVDPSKIPPLGDPSYEAFLTGNIAKAGQIVAMLDQAEQATPPTGYRRTEAGGLELDPGYLEGQRDLAVAKRGADGGKKPALLQVADAYKQAMKRAGKEVSDAQALRWARSSVNDTPQKTWTKIYTANRRDLMLDEPEAREIADEITSYIHGEGFGQPTAPKSKRQIDLNPVGAAKASTPPVRSRTQVIVPIPPETGAPAPRRKPVREIDGPIQPIPRDATGKVDAQRLNRGQVYEAADGTRWRWNGQNFTEVL